MGTTLAGCAIECRNSRNREAVRFTSRKLAWQANSRKWFLLRDHPERVGLNAKQLLQSWRFFLVPRVPG